MNRAAAKFFRRELLREGRGWAAESLTRNGAREVLAPHSLWSVGYAPDSWARLVNHLRAVGFDLSTVRNAGLGVLNREDQTVDHFHDLITFAARNDRLEVAGFIGMRGDEQPYFVASPPTQIYRRPSTLVGVAEQLDLLSEGAAPVLVNNPLDAIAIDKVSRMSAGRWAGIPLCDGLLSAQQAGILGRYAATDTAIVMLDIDRANQRDAIGYLDDLARFFPRVWSVEPNADSAPSTLARSAAGLQILHDILLTTRPLADYPRPASKRGRADPSVDIDPPDRGTPQL